jgi:hypothetical protein
MRLNGRFRSRFQQDEGRRPDACWLIVNHFMELDPDLRERVLQSRQPEVDEFASDGGLVVDSVQLFRLFGVVAAGTLDASTARTALRTSVGR